MAVLAPQRARPNPSPGASGHPPPIDGLAEILSWSAQCPAWQRDALRRLCTGADLTAADEAELLDILKGRRTAVPLSKEHIRQVGKTTRAVTLKSIRNVENINALAPKQTLSFSEKGMTIVYGENGSGKSGYVRILKSACRARREKTFDILPNVYLVNKGDPQTASVSYADAGKIHSFQWIKGQPSDPVLSAISVFDTSAGTIHATGVNDIAYTPFPIQILGNLAKMADALTARLTNETSELQRQVPPTISRQEGSTESNTGKMLQTLSGTTSTALIEQLSLLSDEEKAELATLRKDFAEDPAATATRNNRLAQRLEALRQLMVGVASTLSDETLLKIILLKQDIVSATAAAQAEAARRFASDPLPVGDPAWQALWLAAQAYAEECVHPGLDFPQIGAGDTCVLCQRPHDVASADRFTRFQAFVADELGKQIKATEGLLDQALAFEGTAYLKTGKVAEIREYLTNASEAALATKIRSFLIRAAWRYRWICRVSPDADGSAAPALGDLPDAEISSTVNMLRTKAQALQGAVTSPERKAMQHRLDELADREWLAVVRDDVLKAISIAGSIASLKLLSRQTARAAITKKNTGLAKALVTDRLRDSFAHEVSELGISRLRVELRQEKSEAGQPRFKVHFITKTASGVGAVLSEGELRCLAIAAFLAELETADDKSGIVLDDPVSSLDHIHREKISERLASLAKQRQVIIFTHDVPLLSQLQRACKEVGDTPLLRLISRGAMPGFCHDEPPATHRPIEDAIKSISAHIENQRHIYDTGNPKWSECVTNLGGTMRKLWERAVEDVIAPVLTRWTQKIDTAGFIELTVLTPADYAVMRKAYGICSIWEHYQPAAGNMPQPSADNLAQEADRLMTWLSTIKGRQKATS
jgi:energy-coupling factor transporter ATP-binding protein EcfA2